VERIMLSRKTYSTGLIEELSKRIREVARASYPIRGRIISNEEELRINVGKSVGIEEGMRFNVAVQPDTAFPLPGVAAVVEGLVSGDHASVRIEGMPPGERIPDEGLYAFQMVSR